MKQLFNYMLNASMLLLSYMLVAQDLPEVIPPSPTVASLMHFEEVPIDYYSGQPDIQIPIYNKDLGSGVTIPITLRYSTMGLRVDERSGWVGTGWALEGEAVVSRTVRGIADDANGYDIQNNNYQYGVYHNGFFNYDFSSSNHTNNVNNYSAQNFLWNTAGKGSGAYANINGQSNGDYDKELDLYQVSLFGRSARFVIIKTPSPSNSLQVKMLSNESNLKVDISYNNTTYEIASFTVYDTQGNTYLMDVTEETTSFSSSATILQNGSDNLGNTVINEQISSWKVREIKNSANQLLATYHYQTVNESYHLPSSLTEYEIKTVSNNSGLPTGFDAFLCRDGATCDDPNGYKAYNSSVAKPKQTFSTSQVSIQSKKIDYITFKDQSSIHFNISSDNHPEYNNSGKKLNEILIKDTKGNRFKRFQFIYSTTSPHSRLFLDEVKEYFATDAQLFTYQLDYLDKNKLPNSELITSDGVFPSKDIWGYYKEANSSNSPIAYNFANSADKNKVTTGALKSISYPTGGKKEFNFESNTFSHRGYEPFSESDFKLLNPDNAIPTSQLVRFDNVGSQSVVETLPFDVELDQTAHFIASFEIGNNSPATDAIIGNIAIKLYKLDNNNNIIGDEDTFTFLDNRVTSLPAGRYKMQYFNPNLPSPGDPDIKVIGRLFYKNFKSNYDEVIYGGGIRLKSSIFRDADNSIEKQIDYNYTEEEGSLSTSIASTGVIDGFLSNAKEYSYSASHMFLAATGGGGNNQNFSLFNTTVSYIAREYLNSTYVSMTKGNYVGYSKVTALEYGNGRTVYEYTSPKTQGFNTYGPNYGWPFLPVQDKSHLHGALVKQKTYNNANQPLKEVTNTYGTPIEIPQATYLYTYNDNHCAWDQLYSTFTDYIAHFPSNGKMPPGYNGNASFFDNCVNTYNDGSTDYRAPVYVTPFNYYFTRYLIDNTVSKDYFYDSNGNQSIKESRQEFQYNTTNYQISQQDSYYKIKGADEHMQTKYFYPPGYSVGINSDIDFPVLASQLMAINKVNEVLETQTYRNDELLNKTYNVYGNFSNLILPKEVRVGKGDIIPEKRVEFINLDNYGNPLEVKKTDGIHITYVWGYNREYPIAKIENATYSQISSLVSNLQTLSNADDDRTIGTIGKEGALRQALNNLRNQSTLSNAMVTTYTYDPLIGITSVTDPKGYVMYYEYDAFNRLEFVRDQDGKILSKNVYNYKN